MESVSRRAFVKRASIGAAAAGALAATAPMLGRSHPTATPAPSADQPAPLPDPVIAHVRNLATGEVDLYVGTRHVAVRDHSLANQLTRAAAS